LRTSHKLVDQAQEKIHIDSGEQESVSAVTFDAREALKFGFG
jgi:hypothetical protein